MFATHVVVELQSSSQQSGGGMKSRTGMLQGSAIALVPSMVLGSSAMGAVPASCPGVEVASVASPGLPTSRLFPGPNRESITVEKASIITARDVIKADASHAEV
jgi:hypothetical protein